MNFLIAGNTSNGVLASGLLEPKQVMTGLASLFQLRSFLRAATGTLSHWVELGAPGYTQNLCPLLTNLAQGLPMAFSLCVTAVVKWSLLVLPQPGLRMNSGW